MRAIRVVAAVLALLSVVPLWRILPQRATGLAGTATADAAAAYAALAWNGLLLALIPAVLAAAFVNANALERSLARLAAPLGRLSTLRYALLLAVVACLLAALVGIVVMAGRPTLIDSFAQLTQARYLAAGRLAGPLLPGQEFWHIQQTIVTAAGWVSQYPPGYVVLLALGFALHAVAWVGPVLFGVAVFFTALIAEDVFESSILARVAALLAALSPFMLGMAGAYMSHIPASAFTCAALYGVLRARRGGAAWAAFAGANIGLLFAVRPLSGVMAGLVALLYGAASAQPARAKLPRIGLALLAALPFLVLVGLYNRHFFGAVTTFGYSAALGPNAGLGFGTDPWGNHFGIIESLAYTAAELSALNVFLLETPLPLVLIIGAYFALAPARALSPARALAFAWVSALVIGNAFYWHHGLFMGPRMLADVGTLWVLLAVLAVAGLLQHIPADRVLAGKYSVRAAVLGGALAALVVGLAFLTPRRLLSYAPRGEQARLLRAPATAEPTLVFVHGGWSARVAMRLAAHGMRLDSVETALRQNGTCSAHKFSLAYARGASSPVALDFAARPNALPRSVLIAPGDRIRISEGEQIDGACVREMKSDSAGIVDVTPYVWQGDLPGLAAAHALFARDMGPAENARLMALFPERRPLMLVEAAGAMSLRPYEAAMRARWGER